MGQVSEWLTARQHRHRFDQLVVALEMPRCPPKCIAVVRSFGPTFDAARSAAKRWLISEPASANLAWQRWGCDLEYRRWLGWNAVLLLTACSAQPNNRCIPGASVGCVCTDGRSGAQACGVDGTLGSCECSSATSSSGGSGSTSSNGSATGAGVTTVGSLAASSSTTGSSTSGAASATGAASTTGGGSSTGSGSGGTGQQPGFADCSTLYCTSLSNGANPGGMATMTDLSNFWGQCTPTAKGVDVGSQISGSAVLSWGATVRGPTDAQAPQMEITSIDGLWTATAVLPCCPAAVGQMALLDFSVQTNLPFCECYGGLFCPADAGPLDTTLCCQDMLDLQGAATIEFTSVTGSLEGTIEYSLPPGKGFDGGPVMDLTFSIPIEATPVVPYDGGRCPTDPTLTEFQPCGPESSFGTPSNTPFDGCSCGQVCTYDPFFQKLDPIFQGNPVCEIPCSSDADCIATSVGTGKCTALQGTATPGSVCMLSVCSGASAGESCGSPAGTCIPQPGTASEGSTDALVCTESCNSSTCATVCNPTLNANAGFLCGIGQQCVPLDDGGGICIELCKTSNGSNPCCPTCYNPTYCIAQDPVDTSWGLCLPCGSSGDDGGSPSACLLDADCCEGHCAADGGPGSCGP